MIGPAESVGFSDALVILGAAGLVIPAFARLRINPVIGDGGSQPAPAHRGERDRRATGL